MSNKALLGVTKEQAVQISIGTLTTGLVITAPYLSYETSVWEFVAAILTITILSPALSKYQMDPEPLSEKTRASLDLPDSRTVLVKPSDKIEAYSVGHIHNSIIVSQGALEKLSVEELESLIAHEEAHLTYRHIELIMLFRACWFILGGLILTRYYTEWGFFPLVLTATLLIGEMILSKAWRRLSEYHADYVAVQRTPLEDYLSVLEDISDRNRPLTTIEYLLSTHPTYAQRRAQLLGLVDQ